MKVAILAGGCFWCTEAIYQKIDGVVDIVPGYTGGNTKNPTYDEVSTGETGHAEAVKITFDESKINFEKLLYFFFKTHDPTTLNKQGADIGTQYRSEIFYVDDDQKETAKEYISKIQKDYKDKIVTKISPAGEFFIAEDYHKNYYERNKNMPYCRFVIAPKLEKLEGEISKF